MPTIRTPRRFSKLLVLPATALLLAGAFPAEAQRPRGGAAQDSFEYYLLSLSWTPDFCALPGGKKDPLECAPGRHFSFVVHGLWPQNEAGRGPENCAPSPVSPALLENMLPYIPTPGLIQHEWSTHGSCSGLSAADYFSRVRAAWHKLKMPPRLVNPGQDRMVAPGQIVDEFATANPLFPPESFRVTCTRGELQEVRVCYTKDFSPRPCSASAGRCPLPNLLVRHPR